jgi:Lrp/AsnC family transcriptional regulator, leucine-responsive regulatory protein
MHFMPLHDIDRVDRAIVAALQRDGRIANVDLADEVSLSPSACLRRVKALEADGIIAGYHADVDRTKAGLGLTVFLEIKVGSHSRENWLMVERALRDIPAVVGAWVISGAADFLVEAVVPDLAGYERLLLEQVLTIPTIVDARSNFVIRSVLSRGPMPLDHWR